MKIAFCLSAHLRNFKEVCPNFIENVCNPFKPYGDVDVFIHTWDKLGPKYSWHTHHSGTGGLDEIDVIPEEVIALYNPKGLVIENFERIKSQLLLSNFTTKIPGTPAIYSPDGVCSTTVSFYKTWACNQLKKTVEMIEGFQYDIVCRVRPDIYYGKLIPQSFNFNKNTLYLPEFHDPLACDLFAISNSSLMDKYSDCFSHLSKIYNENDFDLGADRTLFVYLKGLGIDVREMWNFPMGKLPL